MSQPAGWFGATRYSLLLTADTSESPTKCDMTTEKQMQSAQKIELNFSTKDFKNVIMEWGKGHFRHEFTV